MKCARCDDDRWVCEAHDGRPWGTSPRTCRCASISQFGPGAVVCLDHMDVLFSLSTRARSSGHNCRQAPDNFAAPIKANEMQTTHNEQQIQVRWRAMC
jgi:hypothetical protein